MRRLLLILLIAGFVVLGCVTTEEKLNEITGKITETIDPDERTFIYDLGRDAPWPVNKTIAIFSGEAYHVYGGKRNLSINECLALSNSSAGAPLCLREAALYLNDSSICEKIDEPYKSSCYYDYAVEKADANSCDKINEHYYPEIESCKRLVAILAGDSALCSYGINEIDGQKKTELCRYFAGLDTATTPECRDSIVPNVLGESTYFGDTIKWLGENHPGEKVLSWWDYGLPMDCAGLESMISAEDLHDFNIPYVAHLFVDGNESELALFMKSNNIKFVMVDSELIVAGNELGGKYGALNFISCAWSNETDPSQQIGSTQCESDHLWETIFVSAEECKISSNKTGLKAYKLMQKYPSGLSGHVTDYPTLCISPSSGNQVVCSDHFEAIPAYCIGETTLATGEIISAPYHLDQTNEGLKLNKAVLASMSELSDSYHFGPAAQVTLFYTKDGFWLENGTVTDGYDDRTTDFYDSVIYKAVFLDSLEGFEKVYTDPSQSVKVFKLRD